MEKLETSSTSESLKFINDNTKTDSVDSPAKLERQKTHLSLKRKAIRKLQFYCQQQEAKEWIEEVLNIKIKSESLQEPLADGVILCQLMQKIQPSLMMRSIKPATNPYKQMQNVTYFLEACSKYGVKTIFLPDDLVQGTGMESVIHCIHSLARQAEKNGFEPKLIQTSELVDIMKKPGEELLDTLTKEYPSIFVEPSGKESLKRCFSIPEIPTSLQKSLSLILTKPNQDFLNYQQSYQTQLQQEKQLLKKTFSFDVEKDSKKIQVKEFNLSDFHTTSNRPVEQTTTISEKIILQNSIQTLSEETLEEQKVFLSSQNSASSSNEDFPIIEREEEETNENQNEDGDEEKHEKEEGQEKQEDKETEEEQVDEESKGEEFSISFAGKTDPGTRYNGMNQDYFIVKEFQNSQYQLDTFYLFGVFDGHGQLGEYASKIAGEYFLKFFERESSKYWNKEERFIINQDLINQCFLEAHQEIIDFYPSIPKEYTYIGRDYRDTLFYLREENGNFFYVNSKMEQDARIVDFGTTAVVCIIQENKLFIANAGDSEAIIAKISYGQLLPITLTTIHNCDNAEEVNRIQTNFPNTEFSEKGYIIVRPEGSMEYHLAMTKALGHKQLLSYGIIPNPTITEETLTDRHLFLILASDGIWDAIDPEAACEFVDNELQTKNAQEVVDSLVEKALELGDEDDKDNATAVVAILQPPIKIDDDFSEKEESEQEENQEFEEEKSEKQDSEIEKEISESEGEKNGNDSERKEENHEIENELDEE